MSSASAVLCLISAAMLGQGEDQLIYKARSIEVKAGHERSDARAAAARYNYLMYYRIYWGRNYQKPTDQADWGDPDKDFSRLASTYYHARGPLGVAFGRFDWFPGKPNTFHADARIAASLIGMGGLHQSQLVSLWSEPPVAVLGLNIGTQASYARPTQVMHFFERNPELIALSQAARRKPALFQFITDAQKRGAGVTIFPGEHRTTFATQGGDRFYHLIAVEAIKEGTDQKLHEDLLTREGMQMMMSKLAEEGVLCIHTSHRHADVDKLVASAANDLGYAAIVGNTPYDPKSEMALFSSEWVMVARQAKYLDRLRAPKASTPAPVWKMPDHDPRFVWRDGARNSLAGLWRDVLKNRPTPPPEPDLRGLPIEVTQNAMRDPVSGAMLNYRMLLYHRVNIGIAFDKPGVEERGNPSGDYSRLPATYYHPKGPVGCAFSLLDCVRGPLNTYGADSRMPASFVGLGGQPWAHLVGLWAEPPVAVLGLEIGIPAGYARPSQTMHFTERTPAFIAMSLPKSKKLPTFHHVQDALHRGANLQVFPGEPRPAFAKFGGEKFYRLLVVETYKDGIETIHKDLLTREGLKMLMGKLRDDGIVCYHISSRYYNQEPIIAAAAKDLGYACLTGDDAGNWQNEVGHFSSQWVMVARERKYLEPLKALEPAGYAKVRPPGVNAPYWSVPKADARFLWKDGEQNSLRGLFRSDPFAGRLRTHVYDLERFLASFINFKNVRPITAPLHAMVESFNRWRIESLNR
jgi:hypothetical protein